MSNDDLLKILEAHGQQFLESFDSPIITGKRKDSPEKHSGVAKKRRIKEEHKEESEEEEWGGIGQSDDSEGEEEEDSDNDSDIEESEGGEDVEDDELTYETGTQTRQPDVVVFSETGKNAPISKGSKSGFMSSKVTKLMQEASSSTRKKAASDDEDEDLTNAQNDALLHRLVHTKLLSGSLNPELDLTPAKRKKALAGRVLEAAGKAKLGKGEAAVRQAERNRAAKHVREGLQEKQKERQEKELEEAKQLGNYHPTLKALYEDSLGSKTQNRKRERGLKMGVGSFKGGILRLGKNEVSAVEGRSGGNRGRGRGRGGHRRGGKR